MNFPAEGEVTDGFGALNVAGPVRACFAGEMSPMGEFYL